MRLLQLIVIFQSVNNKLYTSIEYTVLFTVRLYCNNRLLKTERLFLRNDVAKNLENMSQTHHVL